jgi:hypothetical protein
MIVNGRGYPLWSQFVERAEEFIGCTLEDFDMGMRASTKVTGITLGPNGEDSAHFMIDGEDFSCGFDVRHGGVIGGEDGYLTFSGYGGHEFRVKNP